MQRKIGNPQPPVRRAAMYALRALFCLRFLRTEDNSQKKI